MMNSNETFKQRPSTGARPQSAKQEIQSTVKSSAKNEDFAIIDDQQEGQVDADAAAPNEEDEEVEYVNEDEDEEEEQQQGQPPKPNDGNYRSADHNADDGMIDGQDPEDYYNDGDMEADLENHHIDGNEIDPALLVMGG